MGISEGYGGRPLLEFADEHSRRSFLPNAALVGVGLTYAVSRVGDPVASGNAGRGFRNDVAKSGIPRAEVLEAVAPFLQDPAKVVAAITL